MYGGANINQIKKKKAQVKGPTHSTHRKHQNIPKPTRARNDGYGLKNRGTYNRNPRA